MKLLFLFAAILLYSCFALQNNGFISRAETLMRNNNQVYFLPYEKGTAHYVVQGYESLFSHYGDYAIDFKMKRGTKVMAARSGIVVSLRDTTKTGGIGKKDVGTANQITVRHSDGTYAHYLHLQYKGVLVSIGDTVEQGQLIGLSGSTGFSAFPHLHFEVTRQPGISENDFPVPFLIKDVPKFLQPLRRYKAL